MQLNRLLLALTTANAVGLVAIALGLRPAQADGVPAVLRGRALEIVDLEGRVRASISVLPAGASAKGDAFRETVLLRLITEEGRPSVKISQDQHFRGSGGHQPGGTDGHQQHVRDPRGARHERLLKLRNEDGLERAVTP